MMINIAKIKKQQPSAEQLMLKVTPEELGLNKEEVAIEGDLALEFVISNVGDVIFLDGTIQGIVYDNCSRCSKECKLSCVGDFQEKFYPVGTENVGEDELFFSEDTIDIKDIVREAFILSIPMASLCQEDCKGLCYVCGSDKNFVDCDCEQQLINPKFAALQSLLKK